MARLSRWASVCLCMLLSTPASAQSAAELQRAEQLFDEATTAFEAGEYQTALQKMRRSFELSGNYRSAAGLGQVELHLGRHRDAAEHLDFSLRHFPATAEATGKSRVMAGLAEARRHTFSLAVQANVRGARVSINGEPLGTTPIDHDLYIEPGEHVVRVHRQGYQPFEQPLFAPAGGRTELVVDLLPHGAAATDEQSPSQMWVLVTGGVVTTGLLGAGLMFELSADSDRERALSVEESLQQQGGSCGGKSPPAECEQLRSAHRAAESKESWASAAWLGAGASALITAGVFGWLQWTAEPADDESKPRLALVPLIGPDGSSLAVSGRF